MNMFAYKKQEKLKMGGSEGKVEIPDESIEQFAHQVVKLI